MKTTKKAAAAEAVANGQRYFTWGCEEHGETEHYSKAHGACVKCCSERNRRGHAHRMSTREGREARRDYQRERRSDPEGRDAYNSYQRSYNTTRKAQDPAYLGASRARVAAHRWRRETTAKAMPATYAREQEAIRLIYTECPEDHHVDHLTPQKATDSQGNVVANGLHCLANLRAVPQRLNLKKAAFFDPDNFRDQRPANAFPGGAWDPEPTETEWSLIQLAHYHGSPVEESLRVLRESLGAQARAHEERVASLLSARAA
ncbi:TPA: hypothetical protein VDA67_001897 [Burkholderia vietnamiensis]|nr:hypothetical protein [Burkholderia vietnamiensis]HEP6283565.1 hypothetical protein [Burkholderia vietnamiensis]HEP6309035.1 hypothetical protein [Burkholderia vietnamiensis]